MPNFEYNDKLAIKFKASRTERGCWKWEICFYTFIWCFYSSLNYFNRWFIHRQLCVVVGELRLGI
jgi:hypothetical protein